MLPTILFLVLISSHITYFSLLISSIPMTSITTYIWMIPKSISPERFRTVHPTAYLHKKHLTLHKLISLYLSSTCAPVLHIFAKESTFQGEVRLEGMLLLHREDCKGTPVSFPTHWSVQLVALMMSSNSSSQGIIMNPRMALTSPLPSHQWAGAAYCSLLWEWLSYLRPGLSVWVVLLQALPMTRWGQT